MRLDTVEKHALKTAIKDIEGEVYIFGSRVNDEARGGDIDLLVFSESNRYMLSKEVAIRFQLLCEEKIDIVVMNPKRLSTDEQAFLNVIQKEKFID